MMRLNRAGQADVVQFHLNQSRHNVLECCIIIVVKIVKVLGSTQHHEKFEHFEIQVMTQ